MTKTMFHEPIKVARRSKAATRCRVAARTDRGLPDYDPRLSTRESRWYDLFWHRSAGASRRRRAS